MRKRGAGGIILQIISFVKKIIACKKRKREEAAVVE